MYFKFIGGSDSPAKIFWTSRHDSQRVYRFELGGDAVEVHDDDVDAFAAHPEFKPAPKKAPEKKAQAKKAAKKRR
jgi:hypothetical protein